MEGRERRNPSAIEGGTRRRTMDYFAFGPLFLAELANFGTAAILTRADRWK